MQSAVTRFEQLLDRIDARVSASGIKLSLSLFLLAFILKAIYVLSPAHALEVRVPVMDAEYYDDMARAIASQGVIRPGAYFMGPLYPYFLALVYSTYGRDFLVVRLIQAMGGALSVVVTFYLGRWVFRPAVGLLAALLLCFYGAITFYEGQMLMTWLGTLLNVSALAALISARRHSGLVRYAAAGLLIGLSALARANVLVFVPVALAWIVWIAPAVNRRRIKALVFAVAVVVAVLPATIHNYVASRDFVLVTSNAGLNFYIGNSAPATGIFYPPPGVDFLDDTTTRIYIERKLGRDMRPSEISRYWFGEAIRDIAADPAHAVWLLFRKAGLFFNGYELPQLESFDIARQRHGILRFLFVGFWFLGSLGIVGIVFSLGRWKENFPLWGFVLAYAVSIIAFFVTARFRVPVVPVLSLFAANALIVILPRYLVTIRRSAVFFGAFAAILLLTNPSLFGWDRNETIFRDEVHRGRRLSKDGKYSDALAEIDRAIGRFPGNVEGYIHRAIIHKAGGNRFATMEDYTRALELRPDLASVHYDLAQTMRELNLREQAIGEYRAALKVDSLMIKAQNNLGITLREIGRYDEAAIAFERVIQLDPSYVKGYSNLGASLAESGRVDDAIRVFERAVEQFPDYPNSYRNLSMAYATAKQVGPAIRAMEQYVALVPGDQRARDALRSLYIAARADTAATGQ